MSNRVFHTFLYCALIALLPGLVKGEDLDIDISRAQIMVPGGQAGTVVSFR